MKSQIKAIVPTHVLRYVRRIQAIRSAMRSLRPISKRKCNICGYHGWFEIFGRPPRLDAQCPNCLSLERHRLLMLALGKIVLEPKPIDVLHFAPEAVLEKVFRRRWSDAYRTADLFQPADLKLDLEAIELPDSSLDLIIANHVLEHVDDVKASQELCRILRPGGYLLCMVPIVEGWNTTYENSLASTDEARMLHFGQEDHIRFYGRDFRTRICNGGGFDLVQEVTSEGQEVVDYGLLRGEKVFLFRVKG